jgi:hypothetical protein
MTDLETGGEPPRASRGKGVHAVDGVLDPLAATADDAHNLRARRAWLYRLAQFATREAVAGRLLATH